MLLLLPLKLLEWCGPRLGSRATVHRDLCWHSAHLLPAPLANPAVLRERLQPPASLTLPFPSLLGGREWFGDP